MYWFADTLVDFLVSHDDGADGISVIESLAPQGDSPPYHMHRTEDEVFRVLEGELTLLVDGERRTVGVGETVLPRRESRIPTASPPSRHAGSSSPPRAT